jgi:hypothetical protein
MNFVIGRLPRTQEGKAMEHRDDFNIRKGMLMMSFVTSLLNAASRYSEMQPICQLYFRTRPGLRIPKEVKK